MGQKESSLTVAFVYGHIARRIVYPKLTLFNIVQREGRLSLLKEQ
jgi:hypothetical protein